MDNEPINNPFANMNHEKNEMEEQKKKTKRIIIISSCIVAFLIGYIFFDMIRDSISGTGEEPVAKEDLDEVALDLEDFIESNNLDALDAYGSNEILRVAISSICLGVHECKVVEASSVSDYVKTVFNKETTLKDVMCEYNDGVLYSYDEANGIFVYNSQHVHESLNVFPIYTKVNSIKKQGDKYVLTLNKLYYSSGKSEYITTDPLAIYQIYVFSDYDMPSDNGPVLDMAKLTNDYENDYGKLKNRGTRYRYTFGKKGKKYYLEKYEVIEPSNYGG